MNDKDFKKLFLDHKVDIPDDGFSERIRRQLPERKNRLPQLVMILFMMIGFVFLFLVQGITPLFDQIINLTESISQQQAPSAGAVITYCSLLAAIGIVGYSALKVVES
jgi:hypothetical protein